MRSIIMLLIISLTSRNQNCRWSSNIRKHVHSLWMDMMVLVLWICGHWGGYLCIYIAFSNFQFFIRSFFLFCWFFPLYMYINNYRNIGCILYIRPFWAELKAVKSVWARGISQWRIFVTSRPIRRFFKFGLNE